MSPLTTPRETPLKARVIQAAWWVISGQVAGIALQVLSHLVLTRLLFPDAFGLMALIQVCTQGLAMMSDLGLKPCIIQNRRGDDPVFLDTAWTIQAVRGVLLWLFCCALAWPMARFYHQPRLLLLVPAVGFNSVLSGLVSTRLLLCDRHLLQKRLAIIQTLVTLFGLSSMAALAWWTSSVWALVAGGWIGNLATLTISHSRLMPGRANRPAWNREARAEIYRFARWIVLSTFLSFLAVQADRLLFGSLIPITLLGVYTIGSTIARLPFVLTAQLSQSVAMPTYARSLDARTDLDAVYRRVHRHLLTLGGLGISGLIVYGPLLIRLLYDSRYHEAGWILQLLALGQWFDVMSSANGSALLALARLRWQMAGNAIAVAALGVAIPVAFAWYGFTGAVGAMVVPPMLKYITIAAGARINGLQGLGIEFGLTAALLGCGAVALGLDRGALFGRDLAATIGVTTFCFGAVWGPLAWSAYRAIRSPLSDPRHRTSGL
jgi:O-antigen/teichoic acid export membrane protein